VTSNPAGWNVEPSSLFPAFEVRNHVLAAASTKKCCASSAISSTSVLPKVAPAISAETSIAKVPNTPDGQFALWPGQDPNVHRLGFYEFEIEATPLDKALWAAELLTRQSPFLTIELCNSELKIISETKDASFVISSSAPLLQLAEIGNAPIRFKVKRHIMRTIRWMPGPLAFTFDRHSSLLRWIRYDLQGRSQTISASKPNGSRWPRQNLACARWW